MAAMHQLLGPAITVTTYNENLSKHAHFFREGKAGAWKNYSDRTVFSKIEDRFGVTMKEHGYL